MKAALWWQQILEGDMWSRKACWKAAAFICVRWWLLAFIQCIVIAYHWDLSPLLVCKLLFIEREGAHVSFLPLFSVSGTE